MTIPCMQDAATQMALYAATDFVTNVDRVKSIIELMDDAMSVDISNAEGGKVESSVSEVFATNVRWLFGVLEHEIQNIRGALSNAGATMEPRI